MIVKDQQNLIWSELKCYFLVEKRNAKTGEKLMKERNFRIDNMRAILILLVVFGHLLEIMPFQHSNMIYQFVYVFHMPGFALLSGLCWKKDNTENVFRKLIYPYMVF